jgi:pyruvate kinase
MVIVEAVASSAVKTSFNLQTPVIVCLTEKGHAARCVAKYRPYCPVLNYTSKVRVALYFAIMRGIFTILYDDVNNIDSVISHSCDFLINNKLITTNTNLVLLSGLNEKKNGTTDQMRVINISEYLNIKH